MQPEAAVRRQRERSPSRFLLALVLLVACVCMLMFSLPELVNGAARLTGLEQPATFHPVSYSRDCNPDSGCAPKTDGYLSGTGDWVSLPGKLALDSPVQVRAPVWAWGWGRNLLTGPGDAIVALVVGLFLTVLSGAGCAILGAVFLGRATTKQRREPRTVPSRPREGG